MRVTRFYTGPDDRTHFEMIILEGAQAGLAWITILRKRENYRKAYDNFDVAKVALFLATDDSVFVSGTGIVVDGGIAASS